MIYLTNTSELKSLADAIRSKTKTSASLSYPLGFVSAINSIPSEPVYQNIDVTPMESAQVFTPASGYDAISVAHIGAISSDYVGTAIPRMSSINISGQTATVPYGYYSESVTNQFPMATVNFNIPDPIGSSPFVGYTWSQTDPGRVEVIYRYSSVVSPIVAAGYISEAITETINFSFSTSAIIYTVSSATIIPTESIQTAIVSSRYLTGDIKLAAISSTYVGTQVPRLGAQTYTPGISDQYISSGYYLTGNQTIMGDANLIPSNIKSGISLFGITGTYDGFESNVVSSMFVSYFATFNQDTYYENPRVTKIGQGIFADWDNLVSVSFASCSTIGSYAFWSMSKLSSVFMPLCEIVYEFAFQYTYISSISFPMLKDVKDYAFYSCSYITEINLPSCLSIADHGFGGCSRLVSVNLPVCTFLSGAFAGCTALSDINCPNCKYIGEYTFNSCYALSNISADNCSIIGSNAFYSCSALSKAIFPACLRIDDYAFANNSNLSLVSFPLCSFIGSVAFRHCINLVSIEFPSCTKIGSNAFWQCSSITNASFPICGEIETCAFSACSKLNDVYFPVCSVIEDYAFYGCASLVTANFPNVKSIGWNPFPDTKNLGLLAIESLGNQLSQTYLLETISLPECSVLSANTFYRCSKLQYFDGPKILSLSGNTFVFCSSVSYVKLSVCSIIYGSVFSACYNLLSVYLYSKSVVSIIGNPFFSTPILNYSVVAGALGTIYVPSALLSNYLSTYSNSNFRFSAIEEV